MEPDFEIPRAVLDEVREALAKFLSFPQPEIPLREVERSVLLRIGCRKEKTRGGAAFKYSHRILENDARYTAGIFSIHRKGGSKEKPLIRRNDFKAYLLPHIIRILEVLERTER